MLEDFRKRIMDRSKSLGKDIDISKVDEINENINQKIKRGYNKYDVLSHYLDMLGTNK